MFRLITANAARADSLSEQDYREIYDELRSAMTLRQFAQYINSAYSFAWWSKYERGEAKLDRVRKNELRRAIGLEDLPLSVYEAMSQVDPNAAVYAIGQLPALTVLLAGRVESELTIRVNGGMELVSPGLPVESHVTGVTRPRRRKKRAGISLHRETYNRLNAARQGRPWDEFMEALIDAYEAVAVRAVRTGGAVQEECDSRGAICE